LERIEPSSGISEQLIGGIAEPADGPLP
jgi:hypothetical protein